MPNSEPVVAMLCTAKPSATTTATMTTMMAAFFVFDDLRSSNAALSAVEGSWLFCGAKLGGNAGAPTAYVASMSARSCSSARCEAEPSGTSLPWLSMIGMRPVALTPSVGSADPSRSFDTSIGTVMRCGCSGGSNGLFGSNAENISVASSGCSSGIWLEAPV